MREGRERPRAPERRVRPLPGRPGRRGLPLPRPCSGEERPGGGPSCVPRRLPARLPSDGLQGRFGSVGPRCASALGGAFRTSCPSQPAFPKPAWESSWRHLAARTRRWSGSSRQRQPGTSGTASCGSCQPPEDKRRKYVHVLGYSTLEMMGWKLMEPHTFLCHLNCDLLLCHHIQPPPGDEWTARSCSPGPPSLPPTSVLISPILAEGTLEQRTCLFLYMANRTDFWMIL
ncbi:uncharacterized protein LOC134136634 [Rhea pennata]|uniref:uncharacterized protein LOC134136634 n=1 Tax=Rhea pennata TaxID=8795 RepID=UPI002E252323